MDEMTLQDSMTELLQEHARTRGYEGVVTEQLCLYVLQSVNEDGSTSTTLVLCRPDAQHDYVTKGLMVDAMDALRHTDLVDELTRDG